VSQTSYPVATIGNVVPQPNTTNMLDNIDDRIMQKVQYRKIGGVESLWVTHNVDTPSGTTAMQWAQIDVTGGTIVTTPVQQQIYPDTTTTLWRWMGSLAVDNQGNMALGYSTSNSTSPNFPSIAYSGRLASDSPNTLPQTEVQLVAGAGSQTNTCGGAPCHRWGDYTAMSVDPADDCTFWYTNEYYSSPANGASGNWQTRIGSFKFSSCVPSVPPSAPTIGTAIAGNASISVAFTPGAPGSGTLSNYTADCGGVTNTGGGSPIAVTGLANGTTYTCRVKTTTTVGTSAWSAFSNAVTPAVPDDGFPAGGTIPAGWVQPSGSNAPWVVTNDAAYAGTLSLKSGIIGDSQKSGISYTANFAAGNVSFARKVSSEVNGDFLEFYIDGVLQNRWSGELDWAVVSFPISAGTHTLLWRYVKDGSVSSGSDAAWIDSVTLPSNSFSIIDHYYQNILGRTGDAGGVAFWQSEVARMSGLGADPTEAYIAIAVAFYASAEFAARGLSDTAFVDSLYSTFFNRAADAGGRSYWVGQINLGLSREMVMYAFLFSSEFSSFMAQNVGSTPSRAELYIVIDFYRGAFARLPDSGGFKYWANQFRSAQCSGGNATGAVYAAVVAIAGDFFHSGEYWSSSPAKTNYNHINNFYNAFMRRGADVAGYLYWVNQLAGGANFDTVRQTFIDSPEFATRIQQIVAAGCTTLML
jgi:hypothetical protein